MMAKSDVTSKVDRQIGVIRPQESFFEIASRSLGMAERLLPILDRLIIGFMTVAMLAMIVSVISVYRHPNPQVLLTFPDGVTRCAPMSLDLHTGKLVPRPVHDQAVCEKLRKDGFSTDSMGGKTS